MDYYFTENEPSKMQILEFNEDQKAAMAAALMSVAEEVANEPKANVPLRNGEIIELLSDSEDDDSCEILGYITLDTGTTIAEVIPINVKAEIKEENIALDDRGMVDTFQLNVHKETAAKTHSESQKFIDLDDAARYKCPRLATRVESIGSNIGIWYPPAVETSPIVPPASPVIASSVISISEPVSLASIESTAMHVAEEPAEGGTFTTFMDLTQDNIVVEQIDVTAAVGKRESTDHSERVLEEGFDIESPSKLEVADVAPTIGADQFDDDDDHDDGETLDNDDDDDDDDIIELGDSSEDDDMDEETEKKLVSLIESDSEDSNQMPAEATSLLPTKQNTIAMLIHYTCPVCGLPCGSDKKWKAHVDSEHNFQSIDSLQIRTIIAREGELRYQCKDCPKKFDFSIMFSKMLEHRITHLPFSDYMKCRLCDKRYHKRSQLRVHLNKNHRKICRSYTSPATKLWRHIQFHCPICYKDVKNRFRWRTHLVEEHNYFNKLEKRLTLDSSGMTSCTDCDKKVSNRRFRLHKLSHEKHKSFKCKLCDTFETHLLSTCLLHVRIQHLQGGKRVYLCRYCDAKFERVGERNGHLREKHNVEKQKCEVCAKTFTSTPYLLSHMNKKNHQKLK